MRLAIVMVLILIIIAIVLLIRWPAEGVEKVKLSGWVYWHYGDIASNAPCVGYYPCAGCRIQIGNEVVMTTGKQLLTKGGCPRYTEGAGYYEIELPPGKYTVSIKSGKPYVANLTTVVDVNKDMVLNFTLGWEGPV